MDLSLHLYLVTCFHCCHFVYFSLHSLYFSFTLHRLLFSSSINEQLHSIEISRRSLECTQVSLCVSVQFVCVRHRVRERERDKVKDALYLGDARTHVHFFARTLFHLNPSVQCKRLKHIEWTRGSFLLSLCDHVTKVTLIIFTRLIRHRLHRLKCVSTGILRRSLSISLIRSRLIHVLS